MPTFHQLLCEVSHICLWFHLTFDSPLAHGRKRVLSDESPSRNARRKLKHRNTEPSTKAISEEIILPASVSTSTQVFAFWRGTYYSGKIVGIRGQKYTVLFDDGADSTLELSKLRKRELRVGDRVRSSKTSKHVISIVKDFDVQGDDVLVAIETDGIQSTGIITDLVIKASWIDASWDDRKLSAEDINISDWENSAKRSPSEAQRHQALNAASSSTARPDLSQTAFIISLSLGDADAKTQQKSELTEEMQKNGVTVLSDWSNLYDIHGEFSDHEKRWIGNLCDIEYHGGNIHRVALLGERETSKPRYLFALACGFPCLNISFWKDFKENV
jgi:hypothetical protein